MRRVSLVLCAIICLTTLFASRTLAATPTPAGTTVVEAETIATDSSKVYRDDQASGGKCVVAKLDENVRTVVSYAGALPAGDYEIDAWVQINLGFNCCTNSKSAFRAGSSHRDYIELQFDPKARLPEIIPLRFTHSRRIGHDLPFCQRHFRVRRRGEGQLRGGKRLRAKRPSTSTACRRSKLLKVTGS